MSIPAKFPVPLDGPRAACAKPEHLALVDAAFVKPGGPEAQRMKRDLCTNCPIGERCLAWAMTAREDGIWGGTGPKSRTQHGGPGRASKRAHSGTTPLPRRYAPNAAANVPTRTIRAWALEQGLPVHPTKGVMSEAIRAQYAAAQGA